jgi:glycine/D-amino acid oxidase-like deaminating enzyme
VRDALGELRRCLLQGQKGSLYTVELPCDAVAESSSAAAILSRVTGGGAGMQTVSDNFWLDVPYEAGAALWGEREADVAIVGGGFTGLAAAYFIKQRFPEMSVAVLESAFIGFGSSGRNSGVASASVGHDPERLKRAHGIESTARLARLHREAVSLLEELIERHDIECDYEKPGRLVVAESEKQLRRLEATAQSYRDVGENVTWLDREQARSRFGALDVHGGFYSPDEGMFNPARFVRGMKRVVESLGVEVHENSRCIRMEPGPEISLYTMGGHIRAAKVILATNAYSNPLGLFRYQVLPLYVYNIVTEPLNASQLDELQWVGRSLVYDMKRFFSVYRLTADDRLLFIECDARYFWDVERDHSHRPRAYRSHYERLTRRIPCLEGIEVTHQWGGRIGMTYDGLPVIGCTGEHRNLYYSMGYNGHGAAFAQLAGRMLAELVAGERTEQTDPLLTGRSLRAASSALVTYLAVKGTRIAYKISDRLLDVGR